jgi:hypothetical protein
VRPLVRHLSYANVLSTLCLFILLGGGAYAASNLPRNSVGTKQLKPAAVTAAKIKDGTITGAKINSSTLATVPSAVSAERASKADRATSAASADQADKASFAESAGLLGGMPASGFVGSRQVGYIEQTFFGCSLAVLCARDVLTIEGVTFRAICENAAGPGGLVIKVSGANGGSYGFARGTTESREGHFEGTGSIVTALASGAEIVGATGTIMARTTSRIISVHFEATAQVPTINTAACTVYGNALAI